MARSRCLVTEALADGGLERDETKPETTGAAPAAAASVLLGHLGACTSNATRSTGQRLSPTHDAKLNAAALHRLAALTGRGDPLLTASASIWIGEPEQSQVIGYATARLRCILTVHVRP